MVTKMSAPGRSFGGVADYCLHDRWVPGQGQPESAERVEWTETRNLATEEDRQRLERISLGKAHSEAVRKIESLAGEVYRNDMEGAEGRAREATRRDPLAVYDRYRGGDRDRLKRSASEERMEQVREFDGEQAYEKKMRAMEEARQEKARQAERARAVERARLEWARQETARQSRERRGPERSGPERDSGPSR